MNKTDPRYGMYLAILREELLLAMGCTEPAAVACAAAAARSVLPPDAALQSCELHVSGNIIKNVKSVVVPNTGGARGLETAAAAGLDRKLKEIDELRARLRRTSDRLTELLGTGAMTADTLLDEQKLQLALARMGRRDDAEALREELTTHAAALRARLREMDLDRFGARRLLRAFPRMRSLRYGETLAATREALRTLARRAREARQAARDAAKRRGRS